MINLIDIRNWLFKSLAVEETLNKFEMEGLAVKDPSDHHAIQRVLPLETFSPAIREKAMKALPVYLTFFCLENAIRELINERLTENHSSNWWDSCASQTIKTNVANRQQREGKNRWHVRRGDHQIFYTDFGDLKLLIQNNWVDFQDLLPDQNWISSRLDELESSRNIIAHSNTLEDREIDRIRIYIEDWQRQVG